jgi:hypothetical protein
VPQQSRGAPGLYTFSSPELAAIHGQAAHSLLARLPRSWAVTQATDPTNAPFVLFFAYMPRPRMHFSADQNALLVRWSEQVNRRRLIFIALRPVGDSRVVPSPLDYADFTHSYACALIVDLHILTTTKELVTSVHNTRAVEKIKTTIERWTV